MNGYRTTERADLAQGKLSICLHRNLLLLILMVVHVNIDGLLYKEYWRIKFSRLEIKFHYVGVTEQFSAFPFYLKNLGEN